MGFLGIIFAATAFATVGSARDGLNDACAVTFDADIGGSGVRGAFWAQQLVLLLTAILGLTHYRKTAGKDMGAGLMITQSSLAFALLHQLRARALHPPDAALGSMILDALNSALSIQMSLKEILASRWQVGGVLVSQFIGLVAIGNAMDQFTKGILVTNEDCTCFTFFWWAWLSNCSTFDPLEDATFWVYYALRCLHLVHNALFSWKYTVGFDKDEKQQILRILPDLSQWRGEHEQQKDELDQLDTFVQEMDGWQMTEADKASISRSRVAQTSVILDALQGVQDMFEQELSAVGPGNPDPGRQVWRAHAIWHVQHVLQNHLSQHVRQVQGLAPLAARQIDEHFLKLKAVETKSIRLSDNSPFPGEGEHKALIRLLLVTAKDQLQQQISPMKEICKAQDAPPRKGKKDTMTPPIWNARLATISFNFIPSSVIALTSMAAAEMTIGGVREDGLTVGQSAAIVIAFATACRALWVFGFRFRNEFKEQH
ncbi:hypothetical protein DL768_008710 [Monosporascus sp. mg162]|nr:hypothetical protein DL768_008710 [Monosporascus sp. mg162]